MKTSILCLDLGTTTGWATHERDTLVSINSGTISFKPNRYQGGGMRFLLFKSLLTDMKAIMRGLDVIYFEEVRRHRGVDAAHIYGGFLANLSAWCEEHRIPYQGVPVGTIKKHATGKGNANKEAMIEAAIRRGHRPADDNEADALALLYWAMDHHKEPAP